ncbi:mechanosensitive ion channel family protein [Flavobacterium sp. SM15]|uniref:mechanosensitive ion channel domain-containing protein n=1 Tax=Flavobacterium sp. SM15 TaxID=2908005 RepID=UPI001EDC779C|nr:mechanosensitive ion channel family protein [Flavobacterium sp. SM15]MCG2611965.1 mechanosensitive ion channel family protein [Flavobacterium sp. SM15]
MLDNHFLVETIATIVTVALFVMVRFFVPKIVRSFAQDSNIIEHRRTNLVVKYIKILLNLLLLIVLFTIWGIRTTHILLFASSISAVIGVAMFAQWSILSNITAGIILFFNFPFKIGDVILIHDKDFPVEGEIVDITAFHALLKTKDGERITYPNNLLIQKGITIVKQYRDEQEFMD